MKHNSKKVAFAGIMCSVSAMCIVFTNLLPLSFSLLTISAFCYYFTFYKSGWFFGVLCCVASILVTLAFGLNGSFILNSIIFVPYAILAFALRRLDIIKPLFLCIRILIMLVFANLVFFACYNLLDFLIEFSFEQIFSSFGYVLGTILFSIIMVIFDSVFFYGAKIGIKNLDKKFKT